MAGVAKKSSASRRNNSASFGLDQALRTAMSIHQSGRAAEAEAQYRVLLKVAPNHPDVLHYLGLALHQQKKTEQALALVRRAIELAPGYVDAINNLGNMQKELGLTSEAEAAYRAVIAARPDFAAAHNNLGVVLRDQGRHADAVVACRACLALTPDYAEGWLNLGHALKCCGEQQQAMTAYCMVITLAPCCADAYRNLGGALAASQRYPEALEVYCNWQKNDPGNPVVEHMIAACSGAAAPVRASDGYVQHTFDDFAASFDKVLADLDYRAPELCGAMLAQLHGAPEQSLDVLDAGCGTGLCAPYLKPHARRLDGVDLSSGMLARAALRNAYERLDTAELGAWLALHPQAYDVIVSADTLCYFGTLDAVVAAAATALRPGGHLVFTVEETQDAQAAPDFLLHAHGRYSHTEDYVRRALSSAGMQAVRIDRVTLRQEASLPVMGLVVGARN